ncbi:MAG: ribonuclease P protein component [Ketobacteraceae bacterium]|nr:ribonuclease P protein component [Ketobacteraceae bacterium]
MASGAFQRSQRLLTSRDYQVTFDKARIRFSTPVLLVLAAEQTDQGGQLPAGPARLGLVVGKKHLKRAVDRNRFKRLARESFRHHQQLLEGLDIIVLARAGAGRVEDDREIPQLLDKAWRYIQRKRLKN